MHITDLIRGAAVQALATNYQLELSLEQIGLQNTSADHEGDYTLLVFPLMKHKLGAPEALGQTLGQAVVTALQDQVQSFQVVKGFVNFKLSDAYWQQWLASQLAGREAALKLDVGAGKTVMVEYSSPNTNKPLHLGHLRNIFLGWSVAQILDAAGYRVLKVNLVNDRGIHICKSMLAWQLYGNGETPETSGLKGDHLAGKYYVEFDKHNKLEAKALLEKWLAGGIAAVEGHSFANDTRRKQALALIAKLGNDASMPADAEALDALKALADVETPLYAQAQEMLRRWEANDPEIRALWKQMNDWVYAGFNATYDRMGVHFDRYYYESDTYLLGRSMVEEGVTSGAFQRRADGSVIIDLKDEGLDEKLLLRADGTTLYITQDMGTADLKCTEYDLEKSIYVVGNEQDYHFKVLKGILKRMGKPYAEAITHLSYGMVDLPSGKMKSREGTVVDADDLMDEMHQTAAQLTEELGKVEGLDANARELLYEQLGLGALKFFLLKVDPQKRMLFNPAESVDFKGHTGPFVQYAHARICSVLAKADAMEAKGDIVPENRNWHEAELAVLRRLHQWPNVLRTAAEHLKPNAVAEFLYELARDYNRMYYELPIMKASTPEDQQARLAITQVVGLQLRQGLRLLGIAAPERM